MWWRAVGCLRWDSFLQRRSDGQVSTSSTSKCSSTASWVMSRSRMGTRVSHVPRNLNVVCASGARRSRSPYHRHGGAGPRSVRCLRKALP